MAKLSVAQATVLRATLRKQHEAWVAERLEARNAHLDSLVKVDPKNIEAVRLRQGAVLSIDRRLAERTNYFNEIMATIADQTEGADRLPRTSPEVPLTNRKSGVKVGS